MLKQIKRIHENIVGAIRVNNNASYFRYPVRTKRPKKTTIYDERAIGGLTVLFLLLFKYSVTLNNFLLILTL